jgi:hypothetical protein
LKTALLSGRAIGVIGSLQLGVNLTRTNLSGACFVETFMADCRTLHEALGPSAVNHLAPSSLDVRALHGCAAHFPDAFFQSVSYTPEEIYNLRPCILSHIHSTWTPINTAYAPS